MGDAQRLQIGDNRRGGVEIEIRRELQPVGGDRDGRRHYRGSRRQNTDQGGNGLPVAAPQIGVQVRLFVVEIPDDMDDPHAGESYVLYNPEILKTSELYYPEEGCLSMPGWVASEQNGAAGPTPWALVGLAGQPTASAKSRPEGRPQFAAAALRGRDHTGGQDDVLGQWRSIRDANS